MNHRSGNERHRHEAYGQPRRDERSVWERNRDDERPGSGQGRDERGWQAESREPQFSSDYDETYGSEWDRDRGEPHRADYQAERARSYGQNAGQSERGEGWRGRGNVGMYGGGSSGGYVGGRGGGGYGGSTGTDYGGGSSGGYTGRQARLGSGSQSGYGGASSTGRNYGYYSGASHSSSGYSGGGRELSFGRQRGFGGYEEGAGSSGFGGAEAVRSGGFTGRGPKGYTRSDDRIREDVCDSLSLDDDVDASEIEVSVQNGEVTLEGTVQTRSMKHRAEDIAEEISGVSDVHNRLRVVKGLFNEIKDKVTGKESEAHYANSGTKSTPASGAAAGTNGRL